VYDAFFQRTKRPHFKSGTLPGCQRLFY
jgi:hypothetical protein